MLINFFKTDFLKNKNVYLIANNPKIKNFNILKNVNLGKDDLVIRFGGFQNGLEQLFKGKTDLMTFRANVNNFNGTNTQFNVGGKNILFLLWNDKLSEKNTRLFFDNIIAKKYLDHIDKLAKNKMKNHYIGFINSKYSNGTSPCQGFGFLTKILEKNNHNKVVLVGFSNLTKKPKSKSYGSHNIINEYNYFHKHILTNSNYNVEIID